MVVMQSMNQVHNQSHAANLGGWGECEHRGQGRRFWQRRISDKKRVSISLIQFAPQPYMAIPDLYVTSYSFSIDT